MNLKIQCPKCSKRFSVEKDLTGKTVECGACDHRFPVKEDSVIHERVRVYPGEHREEDFLNRLGRDSTKQDEKGVKPVAERAYAPQLDAIMPASAGQRIALGCGLGLILIYSLIFLIGSSEDGVFQDVLKEKRIILGAFVGLLSSFLIISGAKNWRKRAIMVSLILTAGLLTLVFMRPVYLTPYAGFNITEENEKEQDTDSTDRLDEAGIKARVGFFGMQRKINEMVDKHGVEGEDYVVGIFIENMTGRQYHEIEKFLMKVLSIPPSEGIGRYTRNNDKDSLLVISGLPLDFDTVARRCDERLGEVRTYPEYRLIDLKLASTLFSEPSGGLLKKLTDSSHPGFFSNNLNELKALDPTRVRDAVARLASLRPEIQLLHGDKIVPEFMRILAEEDDPALLSDLGKALRIWASGQAACIQVAERNVKKWIETGVVVPKSFVNYLNDNEAEGALAIVDQLWGKDPELWSRQYIDLGSKAEKRLLFHLEESPERLKKSAILILEKTGTDKSLAALEKAKARGDAEVKIIAQNAIDSIRSR